MIKTKKHIDLLDGESYQIRKIKDKSAQPEIEEKSRKLQASSLKKATIKK